MKTVYFFLLVFILSVPFWFAGEMVPVQFLPGLPLSSLMVFCPTLAASILLYRKETMTGVNRLFKRSFDLGRITQKVWYLPVIFMMPLIALLAYGIMRIQHLPVPSPHIHLGSSLLLFVVFFAAAVSEELGWTGYVTDPMQRKWGSLLAGIFLGMVWALWHIVPFHQAGRALPWIFWQCITLVGARILIVWLYNHTGKSVFAAALCHTMLNISWQLYPDQGSHYDPRITGLIIIFMILITAAIWGHKLTRGQRSP
jgi:membrane protease YdiL (CAAX protease family)